MRGTSWLLCGISTFLLYGGAAGAAQAAGGKGAEDSFRLQLPVNEVVVTFHAANAQGLPVNDLKQSEVRLLDNGAAPRRIVAFQEFADRPLHIGILLDTSESMRRYLALDKFIAGRFANQHFRPRSDEGFVMDFGYASEMAQPPTTDPSLLARGIADATVGNMNALGGTAFFAAIFRACYYEFGQSDPMAPGNVLLLLSDGEDTAGQTTIDEALRACQRSNTVIYAFRPHSGRRFSTGPKALAELTAKTGGRVFLSDDPQDAIDTDLKVIEAETRNQYRMVYSPAAFRHDGSFHRIELQLPDRVTDFQVRTGYYAPAQ